MVLAAIDPRINHVRPCVLFATFQTAPRPGLLKKKSCKEQVTKVNVNQAPPVIKRI